MFDFEGHVLDFSRWLVLIIATKLNLTLVNLFN